MDELSAFCAEVFEVTRPFLFVFAVMIVMAAAFKLLDWLDS